MGREPFSLPAGGLAVRRTYSGDRVVVTLAGSLELDGVEQLAACADQICRSTVRAAVFDVAAVTAVDDAGARTLAAACRCLAAHGVEAEVRGITGQFRQRLERLGITLPELAAAGSLDRVDAMPAGVDAMPAGVDAMPAGVDAMPAGAARIPTQRPTGAVLGR